MYNVMNINFGSNINFNLTFVRRRHVIPAAAGGDGYHAGGVSFVAHPSANHRAEKPPSQVHLRSFRRYVKVNAFTTGNPGDKLLGISAGPGVGVLQRLSFRFHLRCLSFLLQLHHVFFRRLGYQLKLYLRTQAFDWLVAQSSQPIIVQRNRPRKHIYSFFDGTPASIILA